MKEMLSNRYKLIDKLGQGGLGEVYCAFDSWEGRKIALKLTNQESLTSEEIENFKEEYKLLKQLRHPGLVEAYDFSYSDGLPYFSMEYVEGRSLEQVFKEGGWKDLKILVAELCEVLGFVHQRGIIHCDLKPDNIKVTRSPFKIKLLDFGLAEEKGAKINQDPKGTLEFMSPEVFQKESLDERSDLYSLGVILYQAVTSQLPFSYSEPMQLISAHLEEEPKPPKELNPQIPDSLNELILKLLAKNPEERLKNAWELKGILEDEKIDLAQKSFPTQHLFSGGLVGRENEISKLWNGLQTALKSEGKFFLVEGEAGIGKTALLDELKLKSQLAGVHFFRVRCLEKESQTYTPLIEAVTRLFPYLKNRCRLLIAKYSQPLEILIPQLEEELAEKWGGQDEFRPYSSSSASDKESLLSGLADFLVEASIIFPFALCFEDLGWAGSDTTSFLKRLGESINKSRIFLCASLRAEKMEQKKDVNELINSLTNKDHFEIVRLDRFGLKETSDFVASKLAQSQPPGEAVDYLLQHTSGNPLFLIEILKFLIQKGIISLKKGEWLFDLENLQKQEVPKQIGNVLLNNLIRYDGNTKKFLGLSSIIGPRFDLGSIKFLSTLSDDEIFEILFVLLKDEVIHKIPEQPELTYEFSSQSLQKLLYEKHTPSQRKKLHLKLGDFLEQKEKQGILQPKEMLAFHYVNSPDYQKAYKYSLGAAEETQKRFAHNRTLMHIENALKSSQKLKDKGKYLDALMQKGELHSSIGDLRKAIEIYRRILVLSKETKDKKFLSKLYIDLGETFKENQNNDEAINYLNKAKRLIKDTEIVIAADILNDLGTVYKEVGRYKEALNNYNEALMIFKKFENDEKIAVALNNLGILHKLQGKYEKSIQYYEQYLKIAQRLKDDMLITRGLNNLGVNYVILGKLVEAEKCFLQTLDINEKIGYRKGTALNFENLGEVYLRMGDYERALEYFQKSLEIDREIGLPKLGISMQGIGLCYLESGNYQQAGEYLNQSLKHAIEIRDNTLQVEIMLSLARMNMVLNDMKNAEIILDKAFALIGKLKDKKLLSDFYRISGLFLFKRGEIEKSIKELKKSEKIIEQLGLKNEKLLLNLDYCKIYSHLGQNDKVKRFLNESEKILKSISSQAQRGDFYLLLAQYKASQGKIQQGIGDLKTALVEAKELQSPEILWKIHHLLGKLYIKNQDYEAGYKELESAFKIVKEIAQKIEDNKLRESYMKDKKELVEDLKSVAGVMVGVK